MTDQEDKILETKNVKKYFGGIKAVDGVSVDIPKNKIIGLIGPNGSGKSTFFNIISRILDQSNDDEELGKMIFDNNDINKLKTSELARKGLIRTFQNTKLFDKLTVLENILIAAPENPGVSFINVIKDIYNSYKGRSTWRDVEAQYTEKAIEILKFLDIYHLVHQKANVLSGGQRKLLSLALVLMASPKVILLDEPVAGVNPTLSNKIFEKVNSIRETGTTFFIVEHNMDVIMDSCDNIYVMNKGKIIAHDVPEKIQNDPQVLSAYLGTEEN